MKTAPSCHLEGGGSIVAISHIGTQGSKIAIEEVQTQMAAAAIRVSRFFKGFSQSIFPRLTFSGSSSSVREIHCNTKKSLFINRFFFVRQNIKILRM